MTRALCVAVLRASHSNSALALSARQIPVTLIAGDDVSEPPDKAQIVHWERIGNSHILDGPRFTAMIQGLHNAKSKRFLSEWIARHDTPRTIYHVHAWSKVLSPSVFQSLQKVSSRVVLHAHDFFLVCPNGGYFDFRRELLCERQPLSLSCLTCNCDRRRYSHKLWRSARQALLRMALDTREIGMVFVVHDGMIRLLERGGLASSRLSVLRNPVTPWRENRVPAERNRVFLYVGRIDEDKGADLLAKAARQAGVPLRMIGSGPLVTTLARDFPEVEFPGWKSRQEIAALAEDARALVLPTRSRETFGLAAMEALTSGLPVVISNRALLADEVAGKGYGFSCDPKVEHLAALLLRIANDDAVVAAMSRKAHAEAHQLAPSPDEWTDNLLAAYARLLMSSSQNRSSGLK